MIQNFKHKGLKKLYLDDDRKGIRQDLLPRVRDILARMNWAKTPDDLYLPGYRLHKLQGDLKDTWSITIKANWRIIFRYENGMMVDVDLTDYH